jgi:DNA-binding GntR family transcriptional regulator
VLEAIKAADGDAAAALMDEHLDAVERAIRKLERAVKALPTRRRQGKSNGK